MQIINPKTVREVPIDGAVFKVGIVPYGKRIELETSTYHVSEKKERTKEELQDLLQQSFEFVRWGVKGHSGLEFSPGEPVPFVSKTAVVGGMSYEIVSDETMEIYSANPEILSKLSYEVTRLNYVDGRTAKN